jgi:hypothetical protein
MGLPSILCILLDALKLTEVEVINSDVNLLSTRIKDKGLLLARILSAYHSFTRSAASLTSTHWALIHNYLIKPSQKLSYDERLQLTVQPEIGTGGMTLDDVIAVREMRRNHPLVSKILQCDEMIFEE